MDVYVQSFLNSATKLTVSVTTATTVDQLKTLVNAIESVNTGIMSFHFNNTEIVSTATLASVGVIAGSYIGSSNTISTLATKEAKQIAKLELAQLRRRAAGDTTANYYREYNSYSVDLLADKYVGDITVNVSNTLTEHRPWLSDTGVLVDNLLLENGDDLLQEDGGYILL